MSSELNSDFVLGKGADALMPQSLRKT